MKSAPLFFLALLSVLVSGCSNSSQKAEVSQFVVTMEQVVTRLQAVETIASPEDAIAQGQQAATTYYQEANALPNSLTKADSWLKEGIQKQLSGVETLVVAKRYRQSDGPQKAASQFKEADALFQKALEEAHRVKQEG